MKKSILFLFFCVSVISARAHDYFFAFAEMSYNQTDSVLETTIVASAHEFEDALNLNGIKIKELEDHYTDSLMCSTIKEFILTHFSINVNDINISFEMIGYEVDKKGMVNFYLKSSKIANPNSFAATFDLLMDEFPSQQNKLIYTMKKKTTTAIFLTNKRTEIIKL